MKILRKSVSQNYIVTIAIGEQYLKNFEKFSLSSWSKYCERHDLGLIIFTHPLIKSDAKNWKKANWQKLLIGKFVQKENIKVKNICFLDVDILINHYAPNIFNFYDSETFGLVSQVKNIPFPLLETQKRIAYNRHNYYDQKYPLDSALFMTPKQIFKSMKLKTFNDYACTGLIMFNVDKHSHIMEQWFNKYPSNIKSLTGGEEPHVNWEIQNYKKITWLSYKFQAIWLFEQAWNYQFLYNEFQKDKKVIKVCLENCHLNNYFLHFAGSWFESDMWKDKSIFKSKNFLDRLDDFQDYLLQTPKSIPLGKIKP